MSNFLSKKRKLKKKISISFLFRKGQRWRCELFSTVFLSNSLSFDRVAVLVSKKNGNSVMRNKLKRVFREVFRTVHVVYGPCFDILICPKKDSKFSSIMKDYEKWRNGLVK